MKDCSRLLWLFYPAHEIALKQNIEAFTPPIAAVKLQRSGETLPFWLGREGDLVLCSGVNRLWLERLQDDFNIGVLPWNGNIDRKPTPWGWSKAVRKIFQNIGFAKDVLPTDAWLDELRELSHRRSALMLNDLLRQRLDFDIWPTGKEVTDVAELEALLSRQSDSVIKSPWSSSGRGLTFYTEKSSQSIINQARGTINSCGSVTVEKAATKIMDFALLFDYDPHEDCEFRGISVFETNHGAYTGNLVDTQENLLAKLAEVIDIQQVLAVRDAMGPCLREILTDKYIGPVGVDMMVVKGESGNMLDAAVEINLRYTMGFVALRLADFVEGPARFYITPGDYTKDCRYAASNGKLTHGRLALNPPGGDFTFVLEHQ